MEDRISSGMNMMATQLTRVRLAGLHAMVKGNLFIYGAVDAVRVEVVF